MQIYCIKNSNVALIKNRDNVKKNKINNNNK